MKRVRSTPALRTYLRRAAVGGAVALAALALVSCGSRDSGGAGQEAAGSASPDKTRTETATGAVTATAQPSPVSATTGWIDARDQSGDGSALTATAVQATGGRAWLVAQRDLDSTPGPVIGFTPLPEGRSGAVVVKLERKVASGTYWLVLYGDLGKAGIFEYPGDDRPLTAEGAMVMRRVTLTVV